MGRRLAGGASLRRRRRAAEARGADAGSALAVGDVVVADVRIAARGLRGTAVREVGEVSLLELEGIALGLADGVLRIAVAGRGEVLIAVPEELLVPVPAPGDQVEVAVSVTDEGGLVLVELDVDDDGRDDELESDDGEVRGEGVIGALSADTLSLLVGAETLVCGVPAGADLSPFAPGDAAEARCRVVDGAVVLDRLESDTAEFKVADDGALVTEHDDEDEEEDLDDVLVDDAQLAEDA